MFQSQSTVYERMNGIKEVIEREGDDRKEGNGPKIIQ